MRRHEPEHDAAPYLDCEMSKHRKERFESHIVDCEECWQEVNAARRGRTVAEAGREMAPLELRERIRATIPSLPLPRMRPWKIGLPAMALLLMIAMATVFATSGRHSQPQAIDIVLADFHGDEKFTAPAPDSLPDRLGELTLISARSGEATGMQLAVFEYTDEAGHQVAVYRSDESFPAADGANHDDLTGTWTALADGAVLYCTDKPVPYLVVGDDAREVDLAAEALGLR